MLGEGIASGMRAAAEEVPEFLAEGEQSKEIDGNGEKGSFAARRFGREFRERGPKADAEAGDEKEISAEAFVEEESAGGWWFRK